MISNILKHIPLYFKTRNRINNLYLMNEEIHFWRENKDILVKTGLKGYKIKIEELGLEHNNLELLKKAIKKSNNVEIAEIDQDGFFLPHFGSIKNVPVISKKIFNKRKRFSLKLIAINGVVGIKKNFKDNKQSFLNELRALHYLGMAGCNVPAILDIDFKKLRLTFSYIQGLVLREEIAKKGAILRDRDVENNPDYLSLDKKTQRLKRIEQGKQYLHEVIDNEFIENIFIQLQKIHKSNFIWNDIKYGNIVIERKSHAPYLIDFNSSKYHPHIDRNSFNILKKKDIKEFNLHFDTNKSIHH